MIENPLSKIVSRSCKLFVIGLFLIGNNLSWQEIRVPGVLQRFAISYLIVGLLQVFICHQPAENNVTSFADLIPYWPQWLVMGTLELAWFCLAYLLPVPGCPTGYLGPGGLHENSAYYNCTGGAARWIDLKIFGSDHMFQHVTSREVFQIETYYGFRNDQVVQHDPCGILGAINSILIVFLGLQAGKILTHYTSDKDRIIRFVVWGCKYTVWF